MQVNTFFKTLSAATLAVVLAACGGQKDSAPAASSASPVADNGAAKRRGVNICILFSTVNNNAPQHHFSEYAAVWVVQHF